MTSNQVSLPESMSYEKNFIILKRLSDNFCHKTFDGGGYVALVKHVVGIVGLCERHGFFEKYMSYTLFIYKLRGHPMHWCATVPEKSIHSLSHLVAVIDNAFNHYEHKALNK